VAVVDDSKRRAFADVQRLAALTEVNLDDLCDAFGLAPEQGGAEGAQPAIGQIRSVLHRALRRVGRPTAARFAELLLEVDASVARLGLRAASLWGLGALHTSLRVTGAEQLPADGPLLFVSNHPGMTDTLALFAAIPRPGLRTIAARRAFLELLPNMSAPLFWVDDAAHVPAAGRTHAATSRMGVVRAATAHLRAGGALLTFPAGRIEPDPAVWPGAESTLADWNPSMDLFARLAPELMVVPTLVSGVFSHGAAHTPLRRLRRTRAGQDLLRAMLQLSFPPYKRTHAAVRFGAPLPVAALARNGAAAPPVTQAVAPLMRVLMQQELRDRRSELDGRSRS